jgi:two-component system, OmpR family, phosphate regulon sensor histidine kinase PhoR
MGFAQWFWRLFFVFAGLIVAHVLVVTLLVQENLRTGATDEHRLWQVWIVGGVVSVAGALATSYCARRIVAPLAELSRRVREISTGDQGKLLATDGRDELGVLAGAFRQMERDLARRLNEIQRNNERLETVLGSMAEGVLAVGPDNTILLANDAGRELLDFVTPDPVGRPLLEVTRARPVYEAVAQALSTTTPVVTEFDAPGLLRRRLSLRATRLPGLPCPGVMVVLHDMTDLRRLENLRRELVANVSHELKTPLSAIKGYAETLRLGAVHDPEHNLHFVHRIEEQADRLHELILDILQIARVESGQESFELGNVHVIELIEQCAEQFAELAAARQIGLTTRVPEQDIWAWADEEGLRTILSNLVDNAIKYTPAGGTVVIRAAASDGRVSLEVQDTGIGIAEKDLARVFERFYRVDKARSRELGGTGLGLSIVKHLVQAFGGNVSVDSQPGRGSTFRVELPRGK